MTTKLVRIQPRVLIIGAGFGGLWAAHALARSPAKIFLLDRNNYHTFTPLLYQVAAAELEPEDIVYPVRSIVRRISNADFCLAEVRHVDLVRRRVLTDGPEIPYDYLILATGSVTHFFGVPGASEYAFLLKTMEQGIALRSRILSCFERAMHEGNEERRRQMLTFAIVGGGPTGVEFAGALAELVRGPLVKDYRRLDFGEVRVVLLEATGSLIAGLPHRLSEYVRNRLQFMGVDVRLNTRVSEITQQSVHLHDGTVLPTETVVWTAGVHGDPLVQKWGLPTTRNGRVVVLPTLQLPDYPHVYVIGDLAHVQQSGQPLPMIAPVAIQQGVWTGKNIARQMAGQDPVPFLYKDPGTMATVGRNAAVVRLGRLSITGYPAWVVWLGVHLFKLIGFRNRILVLINWAWDYIFFERAVRLIMPAGVPARGLKTEAEYPTASPSARRREVQQAS